MYHQLPIRRSAKAGVGLIHPGKVDLWPDGQLHSITAFATEFGHIENHFLAIVQYVIRHLISHAVRAGTNGRQRRGEIAESPGVSHPSTCVGGFKAEDLVFAKRTAGVGLYAGHRNIFHGFRHHVGVDPTGTGATPGFAAILSGLYDEHRVIGQCGGTGYIRPAQPPVSGILPLVLRPAFQTATGLAYRADQTRIIRAADCFVALDGACIGKIDHHHFGKGVGPQPGQARCFAGTATVEGGLVDDPGVVGVAVGIEDVAPADTPVGAFLPHVFFRADSYSTRWLQCTGNDTWVVDATILFIADDDAGLGVIGHHLFDNRHGVGKICTP